MPIRKISILQARLISLGRRCNSWRASGRSGDGGRGGSRACIIDDHTRADGRRWDGGRGGRPRQPWHRALLHVVWHGVAHGVWHHHRVRHHGRRPRTTCSGPAQHGLLFHLGVFYRGAEWLRNSESGCMSYRVSIKWGSDGKDWRQHAGAASMTQLSQFTMPEMRVLHNDDSV